jgi:hypothetical protein
MCVGIKFEGIATRIMPFARGHGTPQLELLMDAVIRRLMSFRANGPDRVIGEGMPQFQGVMVPVDTSERCTRPAPEREPAGILII